MKRFVVVIHVAACMAIQAAGAQPVLTEENTLGRLLGLSVEFIILPAETNDRVQQLVDRDGPDQEWDATVLSFGPPSLQTSYFATPRGGMPAANDPRLMDANVVAISMAEVEATWTYHKLDELGLHSLGKVTLRDVDQDGRRDTLLSIYNPATLLYPYPLMMGTTWTDSTTQTLEFRDAPPVPVETVIASQTVEGWGTMIAPDGTVPALRIRTDARVTAAGGQKLTRHQIRFISPVPEGLLENRIYASRIEIEVDSLDAPLTFEYVSLSASAPTSSEGAPQLAKNVKILPNFPNPFASRTTIPFRIDEAGRVRITVFDIIGRRVTELLDRRLPPGHHRLVWDVDSTPSGMYRVQLEHDSAATSRLVVLGK